MKLLLDQDVYERTARFLVEKEYDVLRLKDIGMSRASDEDNLAKAAELGRLFVTRDRDYGNLVFVKGIQCGVLYLRLKPAQTDEVHEQLEKVLARYSADELHGSFVVVEPRRHRFRRIK